MPKACVKNVYNRWEDGRKKCVQAGATVWTAALRLLPLWVKPFIQPQTSHHFDTWFSTIIFSSLTLLNQQLYPFSTVPITIITKEINKRSNT